VNFTREPIIETVITPREGCKLVVRSSKGSTQEDYFVDAVEVVSFGHSFFFRSSERPKSFLVPVSDYEILELKETRMVLKNATAERSIKIGGGREAPMRPREAAEPSPKEEGVAAAPQEGRGPEPRHSRDGKRRRGRRGRDRSEPMSQMERSSADGQFVDTPAPMPAEARGSFAEGEPSSQPEEPKAPSFISKLFPPPTTLIKETLSRYKPVEPEVPSVTEEVSSFEETIFEHSDMPPELSEEEKDSEE
jgi:hypothetical protein